MGTVDFTSTSINFSCSQVTFRSIPSTFHAAGTFSLTFRQLSVLLRDLLHIRQIFMQPDELRSTFVYFRVARIPSINFHKLSLPPGHFPSTFHYFERPSGRFHQLSVPRNIQSTSVNFPCGWKIIRQFPSTFCAARLPSVNFRQLSVQLVDFKSTSVNFLCGHETFQ